MVPLPVILYYIISRSPSPACRSPVFSSVNEAIHGIATIRAFGIEQRLMQRQAVVVNRMAAMNLAMMSLNRQVEQSRTEVGGKVCDFGPLGLTSCSL